MVAASLAVMFASGAGVWSAVRAIGPSADIQPLYVTSDSAPAASGQLAALAAEPTITLPGRVSVAAVGDDQAQATQNNGARADAAHAAQPRFKGRKLREVRTVGMLVTAYSPDERSCGKFADGVTASGYSVFANGGIMVAADPDVLPMGTILSVPGYASGEPAPVLDVGAKIKGRRLDVLFPTHRQAQQWGKRWLTVTVYEFAESVPAAE